MDYFEAREGEYVIPTLAPLESATMTLRDTGDDIVDFTASCKRKLNLGDDDESKTVNLANQPNPPKFIQIHSNDSVSQNASANVLIMQHELMNIVY